MKISGTIFGYCGEAAQVTALEGEVTFSRQGRYELFT